MLARAARPGQVVAAPAAAVGMRMLDRFIAELAALPAGTPLASMVHVPWC